MKESGDLLVKYGLDKLGYVHVDMDGGWFNFVGILDDERFIPLASLGCRFL